MTRDDRLLPLREKGWLSTRPREIQDAILGLGQLHAFPKDVFLFRAGEPANRLFGIVEGQLEMSLPVADRPDVIVHYAGPGTWTGLANLLARENRTVSVRTTRPTVALVINRQQIFALLKRKPHLNAEFFSQLNDMRNLAQSLLTEALAYTATERFARRLAYLAETNETDHDGWIKQSQRDLGSLLGLSPATVQRAVRRLKSGALIETRYGAIRVLDATGLLKFEEHPAPSPGTSRT